MNVRLNKLAITLLLCGTAALAEPVPVDKNQFTLFNRTPRDLMREMSTDRPDTTESAYTVDAGHFQIEMSFVDYAYNDDDGQRTTALSVAPMNLKVGLLNNVDLQFVLTPYLREQTDSDGDTETAEGFGDDTQLRLKINAFGNDSGNIALALMPFVKFPAGTGDLSNDHFEGGLIVPMSITLPADFSMGLMAEFDLVYNDDTGGYGTDFIQTATIGHPIVGALDGYLEIISIAPYQTGKTYQAIGSVGLTYGLTDDIQLDCGGTFGISDSADDFTVFVGMSWRR